jgi:hypothetical protein
MALVRHSRDGRRRATSIYAVIGIAALFALLVARSIPPDFLQVVSLEHSNGVSLISGVSSHDQRPRFDCDGLQWSTPVNEFLPFPPAEISSHLMSRTQMFVVFHVKGFHFNRPPPVV